MTDAELDALEREQNDRRPEIVFGLRAAFDELKRARKVVEAAGEYCSYPDGYTLEAWTEEKRKRVAADSAGQRKAVRKMRQAVREYEAAQ